MSETAIKTAKPFANPYVAGTLLGIVLFMAFLLTGSGLGASGPINRMLVFIEDIIAPQHVNTTPYLIPMAGGSTNPLDNAFVFLTIGILIGGFTSGYFHNRLSFTTGKGPALPIRHAGEWLFWEVSSWAMEPVLPVAVHLAKDCQGAPFCQWGVGCSYWLFLQGPTVWLIS